MTGSTSKLALALAVASHLLSPDPHSFLLFTGPHPPLQRGNRGTIPFRIAVIVSPRQPNASTSQQHQRDGRSGVHPTSRTERHKDARRALLRRTSAFHQQ